MHENDAPPLDEKKDEEIEGEAAIEFDEAASNLVPFFSASEEGKAVLKRIAEQVIADQRDAWDGSSEWRERVAKNNRIITGFLKGKNFPYEGCANLHMPVALERLLRLTSNVYVEIFMERDTIFGVQPTGPDDYDIAEALTRHGNWQIRTEQTDFLRQQHRGVWDFFTVGSVFAHSWRDETKKRNRHDILQADDIWFPYVWTSYEPDLSDMPYKGRTIRKHRRELETLRDDEKWSNVDEVLAKGPPAWDVIESKLREDDQSRAGIVPAERNKNAPYVFYEYHGETVLPGLPTLRPVVVIVDMQTKAVTQMYLREEEDWRDRARYDAEVEEGERYQQDAESVTKLREQEQAFRMRLADPMIAPEDRAIMEKALSKEPPEDPIPPAWMESKMGLPPEEQMPDPIRKVATEQFSHGVCVENAFGALGLSFGAIECELNVLVDEALNRFYDAATLANVWGLVTTENVDLGGTTIPWGPGRQIKARGLTGDQLRNNIMELKPGPANTQLLDIVRMGMEAADSSIAAPSVLSGEPGKSGETFRGLATRVEKATRQLSAAGMKYLDFLSNILRNNARLNYLFLPEHEMIMVLDHLDLPAMFGRDKEQPTRREMKPVDIGRDMYRRDYRVTFTADVRFASQQQRISEADELVGMGQSPFLAGNAAYQYHAHARALRARGLHDMIETLGPPPPMPMVPVGQPPPPGMGPPPPGGPPMGGPPPGGLQGEPPHEVDQGAVPPEAQGPVQGPA